ncbi:hypothetical protein D3C86_2086610 [compost metagenome]
MVGRHCRRSLALAFFYIEKISLSCFEVHAIQTADFSAIGREDDKRSFGNIHIESFSIVSWLTSHANDIRAIKIAHVEV